MNLLTVLRELSCILAALTAICYFYQIVYLILPLIKKQRPLESKERRRYAILIAARNEEAVLPHLLESIRLQDYPAELISTFPSSVSRSMGVIMVLASMKERSTEITRPNTRDWMIRVTSCPLKLWLISRLSWR